VNVALRSQSLNLISLCTGGGGLDLGVELAIPSARSVVLVEREAFSCSHLVSAMQQGLMAEAALWSDVTTFNGRPWRGLVDGLIGGIPCQPHSLAGKRLGEDDERDLWSDARRIIVQSGAWFVLIENVRGMLSSGGAERVWRDLRRLGFDVEGGLFTAAEIGASHERERVFILAVADARYNGRAAWSSRYQFQQEPSIGEQPGCPRQDLADPGRERDERWRGAGDVLRSPRAPEGQGHKRQRDGDAVDDSGHDLADAFSAGLEGLQSGRDARQGHQGTASERVGGSLVYAERPQRGSNAGRGHELNGDYPGRDQETGRLGEPSALVADANVAELRREPSAWQQSVLQSDHGIGRAYLFPPGPADLERWLYILEAAPELEPAFCRVADGLASRLDTARVDRLRMLGNGVVSLEAAYAVRTLATRLAARGAACAERLVRMMEGIQC
jgi:DNA (cytosine-5)-methyltransferase 1